MKYSDIKYDTPSQPHQLRLDTTTRCNAKCLSCHRFNTDRPQGDMGTDLFLEILEDVARWKEPLAEIVPVNYGELLMRKDWAWLLQMISERLPSTRIVLPTNGALFNDDVVETLCKVKTLKTVNFSVNACFDETLWEFAMLRPDLFLRVQLALNHIRALRKDIHKRVSMVFDPMYSTDLERDVFGRFWKHKADEVAIIPAASAGRSDKKPAIITTIPCRSIFSDIVVGYDRKISSCCFQAGFDMDLGEYRGNLLENWHSPELTELRRMHNEGRRAENEICRGCTFA